MKYKEFDKGDVIKIDDVVEKIKVALKDSPKDIDELVLDIPNESQIKISQSLQKAKNRSIVTNVKDGGWTIWGLIEKYRRSK